jgi:hypothetical protein
MELVEGSFKLIYKDKQDAKTDAAQQTPPN